VSSFDRRVDKANGTAILFGRGVGGFSGNWGRNGSVSDIGEKNEGDVKKTGSPLAEKEKLQIRRHLGKKKSLVKGLVWIMCGMAKSCKREGVRTGKVRKNQQQQLRGGRKKRNRSRVERALSWKFSHKTSTRKEKGDFRGHEDGSGTGGRSSGPGITR